MIERVLRSEVQVLKEQNLVRRFFWNDFDRRRNSFSSCFGRLYERNFRVKGFRKATRNIRLDEVFVVPGDSDESPWVKLEMGRACVTCIKDRLTANNIVAVAGGTTQSSRT